MQITLNIEDFNLVDEVFKQALAETRSDAFWDLSRYVQNLDEEYQLENFNDALEIYKAADVLLRYVTISDEYKEIEL